MAPDDGPLEDFDTTRLVELAQDGNREALERLFERAYGNLVQAARFRLGPALRARMDTIDIAQSAYFEAFRDLGSFRHRGAGSFHRWLLQIVENKIRGRLEYHHAQKRDMRREVALAEDVPVPLRSPSPVRKLIDAEDQELLEKAMDELSDEYREVIIYRYYLEMPWNLVGKELGRSTEAAQMLCNRALLKLKRSYFKKP